jgi:hypothetical protein
MMFSWLMYDALEDLNYFKNVTAIASANLRFFKDTRWLRVGTAKRSEANFIDGAIYLDLLRAI